MQTPQLVQVGSSLGTVGENYILHPILTLTAMMSITLADPPGQWGSCRTPCEAEAARSKEYCAGRALRGAKLLHGMLCFLCA